ERVDSVGPVAGFARGKAHREQRKSGKRVAQEEVSSCATRVSRDAVPIGSRRERSQESITCPAGLRGAQRSGPHPERTPLHLRRESKEATQSKERRHPIVSTGLAANSRSAGVPATRGGCRASSEMRRLRSHRVRRASRVLAAVPCLKLVDGF
ncbi:MAG: hypothetical protein M1132_11770, partial [Chloroflexi bacterium]|nr:hypothetical protein [Chloroflexota bacterium]